MARESTARRAPRESTPPPKTPPVSPTPAQMPQVPRYVPGEPEPPDGLEMLPFVLPTSRSDVHPPPPPPPQQQPPRRLCRRNGDGNRLGYVPVPVPSGPMQFVPDSSQAARCPVSIFPVQGSVGLLGRKPRVPQQDIAEHSIVSQLRALAILDGPSVWAVGTNVSFKVNPRMERDKPHGGGCNTLKCDGGKRGSCSECSKTFTLGAA